MLLPIYDVILHICDVRVVEARVMLDICGCTSLLLVVLDACDAIVGWISPGLCSPPPPPPYKHAYGLRSWFAFHTYL